jgi:L-alanine-DL-glutamate epimerase-like enolase superfamily enzyme
LRSHEICEYPFAPKPLAREVTSNHLERDKEGYVALPNLPGLGIELDPQAIRRYFVPVEIKLKGDILFKSSDGF